MAALIREGTRTDQSRKGGLVSELAVKSEAVPFEGPSASVGPAANQGEMLAARPDSAPVAERVYRHRLPVRISHWLNLPCLIILIMSVVPRLKCRQVA
jgi:hypothetical protein